MSCQDSNHQQINYADPDIPQWTKEVIWYQIFPERFRNGDTTNDPTYADIQGCWPHDTVLPWQPHPWGSEWYKLQPYEKENGNDIWYNITRRRYGGDLQGIIDKLDYLQELGIGAIYLNPVFTSPSLHKYDAACYHHVDPTLGPDPKGDKELIKEEIPDDPTTWVWTTADKLLLKLIEEVHKRDMKIILDGVFNHVGFNHFAFQDVLKNQENSRFKDWFCINTWEDKEKGTEFEYEGWWGVKDMPVLREDENGIVAGPKEYIFASVKRWMDPYNDGMIEKGIDGWRLDVANEVGIPFWKDFRSHVKTINPEAYITGEVTDTTEAIRPYVNGDVFDGVMNYNFTFIASEYFIKGRAKCTSTMFNNLLQHHLDGFPMESNLAMQNLLASHDTDRPGSRVINRRIESFLDIDHFFNKSKATNRWYKTHQPRRDEVNMLKLMVIFQMTFPGAPMIYYGDEVGMWGAKDPCCRKPMVRNDIEYEDEVLLADGRKWKYPDKVQINRFLLNHYIKMATIRNHHKVLQLGNYRPLYTDDVNEIFAFERSYDGQKAIIVLNNSLKSKNVNFGIDYNAEFMDILNDNTIIKTENNAISLKIGSKWASILITGKSEE